MVYPCFGRAKIQLRLWLNPGRDAYPRGLIMLVSLFAVLLMMSFSHRREEKAKSAVIRSFPDQYGGR